MESNKEINTKEKQNVTEQIYVPYNIKCPQKLWENKITTNCEDVPRWKELMMEYKIKKYIKKPIPTEAIQHEDEDETYYGCGDE